mgnify:FL=1
MSIAYILGYSSGSGTTALAAGLAKLFESKGKTVSLVKANSSDSEDEADLFSNFSTPPRNDFDLSACADVNERIKILHEHDQDNDMVIVDGGSSDRKQQQVSENQIKLINECNAKVFGVVGYDRMINTESILAWSNDYGDYFAGVIINKCHQYAFSDIEDRLIPELSRMNVRTIGTVPEERTLIAPTISQVIKHIGAQCFVPAEDDNDLIENFLIGGLITEWGGNYFNRLPKQAVIVRGGRIDIQMSALNFPLKLLILTNCDAPSQYVFQRAEGLGVPLATVPLDTHETMVRLETVQSQVNVAHPQKIKHLSDVLELRIDLDFLQSSIEVK